MIFTILKQEKDNAAAEKRLREEFDKWDKNHNGKIEYEEYKEYFLARMQFNRDQFGGNQRGPASLRRARDGARLVCDLQRP